MRRGKSARGFALDLRKFGTQTHARATQIFHKLAIDLDTAVVLATPVDEGRARGNWYVTVGQPSTKKSNSKVSKSGGEVISEINSVVPGAKLGNVIWLTNNLPYILRLENGWSSQAPEGMVDVNLVRYSLAYG